MRFHVVADEDTVTGFRYAGVEGVIVGSAEQAGREMDRLAAAGEDMIVITTEQVANSIRDKINAIRFKLDRPLIVEVPGPAGPSEESPSLLKLIREAAGITF